MNGQDISGQQPTDSFLHISIFIKDVKIKMGNTYTFYIEESNGEMTERTFKKTQVKMFKRLSMPFEVRQLHTLDFF